jgi:hypothetical protein
MRGLKLIITEFENLENEEKRAESTTTQVFVDDEYDTAHNKINTLLEKRRIMMYLGWNQKVYPQFEVREVNIELY